MSSRARRIVSLDADAEALRASDLSVAAAEPVADDLAVVHRPDPARGRRASSLWRILVLSLIVGDILSACAAIGAGLLAGGTVSAAAAIAAVVGWIAASGAFGLYARRLAPSIDETRRIVAAAMTGITLFLIATAPSSDVAATAAVVGLAASLMLHRVWRGAVIRLLEDGRLAARAVIVGTGADAASVAHALARPGSGYVPLGFVATEGPLVSPNGLALIGRIGRIESIARAADAECLFIAGSDATPEHVEAVARAAHRVGAEVRVVTKLPSARSSRVGLETIAGTLSIGLAPVRFGRAQAFVKRALDLVAASILLVLSAPAWGVIVMAIRAGSPGPAIFRQRRATLGGRTFTCLKFRTMVADAEARVDGDARAEAFFKPRDDARVTRVGRFLRRTSLDELPQLLNVLRGDMSMVGPRPLPIEQVEANAARFEGRHDVRAGLTGWWQVNGRSDVDPDEAVRLDLFYIRNWSVTLDLYILWRTARAMLDRRGAL